MDSFLPYMTNDYSVGLYERDVDDIYHSAYGALSEAYEKFINPIKEIIFEKNNLNVLDICYGIGYNTKALLQTLINTDKKITIDCVDTNKFLFELSPFISSKVNYFKRLLYKKKLLLNIQEYNEAKKIVQVKNKSSKYTIDEYTNFIILKKLIEQYGENFLDEISRLNIQNDKENLFFDKSMVIIYQNLTNNEVYLYQNNNLNSFVHNIYYSYVSKRYNKRYYILDSKRFNINFYHDDIRNFIVQSQKHYDIIFLDGFTPQKCPCIWTLELFKEMFNNLNSSGVIVTYNTSAPVRNGLITAGFYIGNIIDNKNKTIGTIASKEKIYIKNELSEIQYGILKTKAGIMYHDENLCLDNKEIIMNRENEISKSDLITSSKYLKSTDKRNTK